MLLEYRIIWEGGWSHHATGPSSILFWQWLPDIVKQRVFAGQSGTTRPRFLATSSLATTSKTKVDVAQVPKWVRERATTPCYKPVDHTILVVTTTVGRNTLFSWRPEFIRETVIAWHAGLSDFVFWPPSPGGQLLWILVMSVRKVDLARPPS